VSFKIRNSIVLGVVWLIITGGGVFYWAYWQPRNLKKVTLEITAVDKQLEDLPGLTDEVQRLNAQFQDVRRRYDSRSKEIPQFDISSQTYGYMSRGIDEASGYLKFDMKFIGTDERGSWGYNVYKLESGEAQFENLFRFAYFLENGRRLYKIATIKLDNKETVDQDTRETNRIITFEMELHAYFVKGLEDLSTSLAAKALNMIPSPFDPFKPLITQTIATEGPEGAVNAEKLEVKAVVPGKAFVLYQNELSVLQLGDPVWRGSVSRIDPTESAVEFTIDEGGVPRQIVKKIQFDRRLQKR
jgi:hypothetical protein